MRSRRGVRDPTRNLFHVELSALIKIQTKYLVFRCFSLGTKGEARRRLIAWLDVAPRKIDRATMDATGRARLKSSYGKADLPKSFAQLGASVGHSTALFALFADMQQAPQKCPSRNYNTLGGNS